MKGAAQMIAKLKQIAAKFPDHVASAIYLEAQIIMTEAKRRCPVARDGGTLRASGTVGFPVRGPGRKISVEMGFGGAAEAYAVAVHEHPSDYSPPSWVNHPYDINWTSVGTGPKFLENPINEAFPMLARRVAERVKFAEGRS